jgi:hypothetical protein
MAEPLIDVQGLSKVSRALKDVDPQLRRRMFAEVGSLVKGRVTQAQGYAAAARKTGRHMNGIRLTRAGTKGVPGRGRRGLFGFVALSSAPYSTIIDYGGNSTSTPLTQSLSAKYGNEPRFIGRAFLPSGQGGTNIWRASRDIVDRYIGEINRAIESQAG